MRYGHENSWHRREAVAERAFEKSVADLAKQFAKANPGIIFKAGRGTYYYYKDSQPSEPDYIAFETDSKITGDGREVNKRYKVTQKWGTGREEHLTDAHQTQTDAQSQSERKEAAEHIFKEHIPEYESVRKVNALELEMRDGWQESEELGDLTDPEEIDESPGTTTQKAPLKQGYGSTALCPECGWAHLLGKGFYVVINKIGNPERYVCDVCKFSTTDEERFRHEFYDNIDSVKDVPCDDVDAWDPEEWDVPDGEPEIDYREVN